MNSELRENSSTSTLFESEFDNNMEPNSCVTDNFQGCNNTESVDDTNDEFLRDLKLMRRNNAQNLIIGHLNVNSLRNKFLSINELLVKNIDKLLLTETKLDDSFPINQFRIDGYRLFRYDRNKFGGGLCLYVNENLACKSVKCNLLSDIESISIEINLRKRKWLIIGVYKPPNINNISFLEKLSNQLNESIKTYGNVLLLGDFNITPDNEVMKTFLSTHDLQNLVKAPTCFKGRIPQCIDLILTNQNQYFMKTKTFITGISDFHALNTSIMKMKYTKGNPKVKIYRDYKNFDAKKI